MDAHNKHLYINDQSWVSYLKIGASKGLPGITFKKRTPIGEQKTNKQIEK